MSNLFPQIPTVSEEELARLANDPNWTRHTRVHFDRATGLATSMEVLCEIRSGRLVVLGIKTEKPEQAGKIADFMVIDDPHQPSFNQKEKADAWFKNTFPPSFRRVRAIRYVQLGTLVTHDQDVSDRVYPDIEQMLLDCPQFNR